MEYLKKNWYLILIGLATIALGTIAVITAIKLYQAGKQPVAPTAPSSKPKAATPACSLTFNISPITPTPTPTPSLLCLDLTASPSASLIPTHYHIIGGNTVLFTCIGSSSSDNPINHFEFRVQINDGEWEKLGTAPASPTDGKYQGQKLYTIPDYGCYKVECRTCVSADSSNCTVWEQAGKSLTK